MIDLIGPPSESEFEIDHSLASALLNIVKGTRKENSWVNRLEAVMPWSSHKAMEKASHKAMDDELDDELEEEEGLLD